MVKILESIKEYRCYNRDILKITKKYVKVLGLRHYTIDIYIYDELNGEHDDIYATVECCLGRNQAALSIGIEKHIENGKLDYEELENSIAHELIHVLMDNMDRIVSYEIYGDTLGLLKEFEEKVVDRLAYALVGGYYGDKI